jgi:hypothetical protein
MWQGEKDMQRPPTAKSIARERLKDWEEVRKARAKKRAQMFRDDSPFAFQVRKKGAPLRNHGGL